jgi:hypothetical protein
MTTNYTYNHLELIIINFLVEKNKIASSYGKQLGLFGHHFWPSLIPVHNNVGVKHWPTSSPKGSTNYNYCLHN